MGRSGLVGHDWIVLADWSLMVWTGIWGEERDIPSD
jgi:hypothetical protein